jgi:septal ring factor EnvC (AmiA/AmiB activator)
MPPRDRIRASHVSRRIAVSCVAVSAGLILAGTGLAQQSQLNSEAAQKLKQSRDRLEQAEQRAQELKADVAQIDQERVKLNARLQEEARKVQAAEARLTSIEARRDELEAQQAMVQGSLAQRHSAIASLLSTMQRMGRNPPPVIITKREDALEMVRSAMLLARALPELQTQVDGLIAELGELDGLIKTIAGEREKIAAEAQRLRDAQARLDLLMETRRQSLKERQGELDEVRRETEAISRTVKDLSELIAVLDQTVAKRTGLGTYEKQEAERQGAADLQPRDLQGAPLQMGPLKPPSAPGQQPVEKGPQIAVLLSPGAGAQAGAPGRMKPAVPFHLARGQLPFPAAGQRILSFGDTTSTGRKSQGIVIETRHGAQITSPCDGWVVYAGEFRSYGQLLIINAGGGYHVLLAGLSHIDAQLGQFVLAGEPVGTMSMPKGKARDNAPVLYVEFRKEGRPIDPAPWWHDGQQQKVQG